MDVEPHRSERGGTNGTFIVEEEWYFPEGESALDAQPLNSTQAENANSKER